MNECGRSTRSPPGSEVAESLPESQNFVLTPPKNISLSLCPQGHFGDILETAQDQAASILIAYRT